MFVSIAYYIKGEDGLFDLLERACYEAVRSNFDYKLIVREYVMIRKKYVCTFVMVSILAIALGYKASLFAEEELVKEETQVQDVVVLTKQEAEQIVEVLEELTARYISLKSVGDRASVGGSCSVGTACGTAGVCGYSDDLLLQQIFSCVGTIKKELDFICGIVADLSNSDELLVSLLDIISTATSEIISTVTGCCSMLSSQITSVESSIIDTLLDVEINIMNDLQECCSSLTAEINNTELSLISAINTASTSIINTQTACCSSLSNQINNVQASLVSVINTASTSIINTQTACCSSLSNQINNVQTSLVSVINTATASIIVNSEDCCNTTTSLIDRIELILRGLLC